MEESYLPLDVIIEISHHCNIFTYSYLYLLSKQIHKNLEDKYPNDFLDSIMYTSVDFITKFLHYLIIKNNIILFSEIYRILSNTHYIIVSKLLELIIINKKDLFFDHVINDINKILKSSRIVIDLLKLSVIYDNDILFRPHKSYYYYNQINIIDKLLNPSVLASSQFSKFIKVLKEKGSHNIIKAFLKFKVLKYNHVYFDEPEEGDDDYNSHYTTTYNDFEDMDEFDKYAMDGKLDIIRLLDGHPAMQNYKLKTKQNNKVTFTKNAIDLAAMNGHFDIIKYVLGYFINNHINTRNWFTQDALDFSKANNHMEIYDYIISISELYNVFG